MPFLMGIMNVKVVKQNMEPWTYRQQLVEVKGGRERKESTSKENENFVEFTTVALE